jgi:hypothetical protein
MLPALLIILVVAVIPSDSPGRSAIRSAMTASPAIMRPYGLPRWASLPSTVSDFLFLRIFDEWATNKGRIGDQA